MVSKIIKQKISLQYLASLPGMSIILRLKRQFLGVGVCNTSFGSMIRIVLHEDEPYHSVSTNQSSVELQHQPAYVLVHIPDAEAESLHLPGLPPGVISISPEKRTFTLSVPGPVRDSRRTYNFQCRQLPLHPGALSWAHKAQGETIPDVLIDMCDAPGPAADPAIGYVALSRSTGLEGLKLLFPVTKDQLNVAPDKGCIALLNWMA